MGNRKTNPLNLINLSLEIVYYGMTCSHYIIRLIRFVSGTEVVYEIGFVTNPYLILVIGKDFENSVLQIHQLNYKNIVFYFACEVCGNTRKYQ
jgi:hypothetical protein